MEGDDLTAILEAGRRAQSSKNTQPWIFVVVHDRETLTALGPTGTYAGHLAGAAVGVVLVADRASAEFDLGQAASYMQLAAHAAASARASRRSTSRSGAAILGIPEDRFVHYALSFGWPTPTNGPAAASGWAATAGGAGPRGTLGLIRRARTDVDQRVEGRSMAVPTSIIPNRTTARTKTPRAT